MKEIEDTIRYYSDRADEYDSTAGYHDKKAEKTRRAMKQRYQTILKNKDVLEIACGTGYWTKVIAETATSVLAVDVSQRMISIAKEKHKFLKNVTFQASDAYLLENISGNFSAAFAHWWWSHIPKSRIRDFLHNLHKKLLTGSSVLFIDHLPTYFDNKIKVIKNEDGDRIEQRILSGGKTYLVIKNFLAIEEIHDYLKGLAEKIEFQKYDAYWELCYTVMK
ncbi:MAG: class I SAM-dependent methyltransferase [bacterium]